MWILIGKLNSAGSELFLTAKLTLGASANDDKVDLCTNPNIHAGIPTTPGLTATINEDGTSGVRAIDEIRLGSQNGAFPTDEIRIGATVADIA
jgi:hypothetical protein